MKKALRITAFLLVILCSLSVFSCQTQRAGASHSRTFYEYFDTVGTLYDYKGLSDKEFSSLADKVESMLREYHELYDIYNEYDGKVNLATINRTAGGGALKVDKRIIDLLSLAKELYYETDGEMNIAMGAVLSIWHDCREAAKNDPTQARVPTKDELFSAAEHTDIDDLVIDEAARTVEILDSELSLDVGAIAKGYAVEMVAQYVEGTYGTGFVLDVGGNLRAIGAKPSGDGWTAGVRNPNLADSQTIVYRTEIKNAALVTSGSYERFYTVGDINYHHIINTETLMPENYYASVSVMTESSALSDALSTAIFNMEYEKAREFVNSREGIFAVLVMTDGEVITLGETPFD